MAKSLVGCLPQESACSPCRVTKDLSTLQSFPPTASRCDRTAKVWSVVPVEYLALNGHDDGVSSAVADFDCLFGLEREGIVGCICSRHNDSVHGTPMGCLCRGRRAAQNVHVLRACNSSTEKILLRCRVCRARVWPSVLTILFVVITKFCRRIVSLRSQLSNNKWVFVTSASKPQELWQRRQIAKIPARMAGRVLFCF